MNVDLNLKAEYEQNRADYFAAKLGIIHLCVNCRAKIVLVHPTQTVWSHCRPNGALDWPCWNDVMDGVAEPMSEYDLADYFEELQEDEEYYANSDTN